MYIVKNTYTHTHTNPSKMDVKPTCKAVTRPNERGARVHPKGCKIRYKVQPGNGYIRKVAKKIRVCLNRSNEPSKSRADCFVSIFVFGIALPCSLFGIAVQTIRQSIEKQPGL